MANECTSLAILSAYITDCFIECFDSNIVLSPFVHFCDFNFYNVS